MSADQLAGALAALEAAAGAIAAWEDGLVVGGVEVFRGDSWQLCLTAPPRFLRAMLFMRARLRAAADDWDTRVAVGIGQVERLDLDRISRSTGAAFTLSGHALDRMADDGMSVAGVVPGAMHLDVIALLCAAIADRWTRRQASVIAALLPPGAPTQLQLASEAGVTPQTFSRSARSAHWPALSEAIAYIEERPMRWLMLNAEG